MEKPSNHTLGELYVQHQLSQAEIARRYEVSVATVSRWLRAAGIPARTLAQAASNRWGNRHPGEAALRQMYLKQRLSYTQIAETCGISVRAVLKWMKAAEIQPRSRGEGASIAKKGRKWTEAQREAHAYRQSPEYRAMMAEKTRGDKSRFWRGGQSETEELRMHGWEWRQLRLECYKRDNWTCRDCGEKCNSRGPQRIQAHHVIPRRLGGGDDLGNLVTLCVSCHLRRERVFAGALIY